MKDWIEIFKTGKHTDSAGNTKTWTEQDLDKIAAYDPANHEAPVVIGHPKDNAPAYGWVEAIKRVGDRLFYKEKDAQPEFTDMRKRGLFKKRSISLYPDGTLRHIGWLGAMPPAIKGLPDVAFSDEGSIAIEFEESAEGRKSGSAEGNKNKEKEEHRMSFWDKLKKQLESGEKISFKELFGSDTPPVLFTEADMQTKINTAVAEAVTAKQTEFSEAQSKKEVEFKTREEALRKKELDAKKAGIASFTEGFKGKGILIPAMEKLGMGITAFMEQIASIEAPVEFGEGKDKGSQTPLEFFQAFLGMLPPQIEFKEVAGRDKDKGAGTGNAGEKIDTLVKEKMKTNKDLTYGAAFTEVQNENRELAAEYAEEIG